MQRQRDSQHYVVDERPAPRPLQHVVTVVLEAAVARTPSSRTGGSSGFPQQTELPRLWIGIHNPHGAPRSRRARQRCYESPGCCPDSICGHDPDIRFQHEFLRDPRLVSHVYVLLPKVVLVGPVRPVHRSYGRAIAPPGGHGHGMDAPAPSATVLGTPALT